MPISRGQMERQLRMGGGIMQIAPRQRAIFGGLKKAVKGVAKGIGSFLKSDLGKAAILGIGAFGFPKIGSFKGFKGLLTGNIPQLGLKELLTKKAADVSLGDTLKVGAVGTVLGGVLSKLEPQEEEEIVQKRNLGALRSKLTQAYQNLGYDEAEIPALVANDMSEYTAGAGGYAEGGRIGYAMGDTAEDNAMQASGIMGLPLNENPAGVTELDLRETGGFIPPVGVKEKADDIPAMLSNNEFVFTADAVRGMGDGNVNLGAQRMYDMMKKLENGGRV
tara:strand:+ start:471 stop:1301 length:831 start_codon:yes stop_codon:yes gene_type:complete